MKSSFFPPRSAQFDNLINVVPFFDFQPITRHHKDVQILTLEDSEDQDVHRGETFRYEGGAEILELDQVPQSSLLQQVKSMSAPSPGSKITSKYF